MDIIDFPSKKKSINYIGKLEETYYESYATFPDIPLLILVKENTEELMRIVETTLSERFYLNETRDFGLPTTWYQGEDKPTPKVISDINALKSIRNFTAKVTIHPERHGAKRYQVRTLLNFEPVIIRNRPRLFLVKT